MKETNYQGVLKVKERGTELNLKQGDELEYEFDKKDWPGMDTPEMLLNIQAKMHSPQPSSEESSSLRCG